MKQATQTRPGSARRSRYGDGGFSLVEVIMAVLVLGTVVAATFSALRVGFTSIQLARDNTLAGQILQSEMENLRMMSWSDLQTLAEEEEFAIGDQFDAGPTERFRTNRLVHSDAIRPGMMDLELHIEWTSTTGAEHRRVYRTRFSQEGLNDYYYVVAR